jgi:hypothetical protein
MKVTWHLTFWWLSWGKADFMLDIREEFGLKWKKRFVFSEQASAGKYESLYHKVLELPRHAGR